jgi:hypothetical protein
VKISILEMLFPLIYLQFVTSPIHTNCGINYSYSIYDFPSEALSFTSIEITIFIPSLKTLTEE